MKRLSRIEGLPVFDADGNEIGHVWDLRTAPGDDAQGRAIAGFLVGPVGWIKRVGLKIRSNKKIRMTQVARLDASKGGRITIGR